MAQKSENYEQRIQTGCLLILTALGIAGALYALEIYLIDMQGIFHYDPERHALSTHAEGDRRKDVYNAALRQDSILQAPCTLVLALMFLTVPRYGVFSPRRKSGRSGLSVNWNRPGQYTAR